MTPYANHSTANAVETPDLYTQTAGNVPQHHKVSEQQWTDSASTNIPRIVGIGVGGGGIYAIDYMIDHHVGGIEFIGVDTDLRHLNDCHAPKTIQLGNSGLGTEGKPDQASLATIQSEHTLRCAMQGAFMVIIVAGLGGGTGTGAAPVIVRIAKDLGVLTVGVVTYPFKFEGSHRVNMANVGVHALQEHVDALIPIPNEKLLKFLGAEDTLVDAYDHSNRVVKDVVSGFARLINAPGRSGIELMDVQSILSKPCRATLGVAVASGVYRSSVVAEQVLNFPLIEDFDLSNAKDLLILISTVQGSLVLSESQLIMRYVGANTSPQANIIYGTSDDESLEDGVRVIILATGSSFTP